MGKPFTVNINRFDPVQDLSLPGLFRHLDLAGRGGEQGHRAEALLRRDRIQGGRQRRSSSRGWAAPNTSRSRWSAASPRITDFANWANAAQVLDKGSPSTSLKNLRQEVRIDLLNEEGQPVWRFFVHRCWVSEYQALPDLDAGANAIAIEHIKLENEGWEQDTTLTEPPELEPWSRLPVSGARVALREPDGPDDMLLREAAGSPVEVGARAARRGSPARLIATGPS